MTKQELTFKRVGTSNYNVLVDGEVKGRVFKASIGYRQYTHWKFLFNGTEDSESTLKSAKDSILKLIETQG